MLACLDSESPHEGIPVLGHPSPWRATGRTTGRIAPAPPGSVAVADTLAATLTSVAAAWATVQGSGGPRI